MRSRRVSALLSIAFVACCASEPRDEAPAASPGATAPEIVYEADLTGLWGPSCALEVERVLSGLDSVASIQVDADIGRAVIVPVRGRTLSAAELNAALKDSPYRVTALRAKA